MYLRLPGISASVRSSYPLPLSLEATGHRWHISGSWKWDFYSQDPIAPYEVYKAICRRNSCLPDGEIHASRYGVPRTETNSAVRLEVKKDGSGIENKPFLSLTLLSVLYWLSWFCWLLSLWSACNYGYRSWFLYNSNKAS